MSDGTVTFLVILGFIALFGFIFYVGHVQEKKRREKYLTFARRMGFNVTERPGIPPEVLQVGFGLFSRGRARRVKNLIRGTLEGISITAFDYLYTTGSGKHSKTHAQTVLLLASDGLVLPRFLLQPENILHRIGEMLGFEDIDFSHAPHFSSRYRLSGPDASSIRSAFNSSVIAQFEKIEGISSEGDGAMLLIYRNNSTLDPESELEPAIRRALEFVRAFR